MSFIAVGGTLIAGGTIGAGTIAAGAGLAGSALSLYGQSQQGKANAGANAANQASVDKANQIEWNNYLMQRGVYGNNAPTGTIPGATPGAVNTRLPLWASINMATGPSRWQKVGANYGQPDTLAISAPTAATAAPTNGAAAAPTSAEPSTGQKLKNILDPLNVSVGKNKNFLDPLGIFCWVAREVYGEDNPRWKQFREWLLNKAPTELREAYRENGPRLAQRIRRSPALREQARDIMDKIFAAEIEVHHA